MALTNDTILRDEQSDAFDDSVNAGANPGALRLWSGTAADGTLLATFIFAATAFDASGSAGGNPDGTIALEGVPISATAAATGTVQSFDIVRDNAGTPVRLTRGTAGSVGTEDVVLDNANVASGQSIDLQSLTYNSPAA